MIYEGYEDHRGRTGQALVFFYFLANGSTNLDVFIVKPSASPGESSLKISGRWGSPFRRSYGKKTNKQAH